MSAKRTSRRNRQTSSVTSDKPKTLGMVGGRYHPLSETDLQQIDETIRYILSQIGFSEAPKVVVDAALTRGVTLGNDGRLRFPESLFDEACQQFQRNFSLYGQTENAPELNLSGKRVHVGSGGAAPQVIDLTTGHYRDSTLKDLYDAARLVDCQDNIHFFSRSLVARDMPDLLSLDINTAYACLTGTAKHCCVSVSLPEHVEQIAEMCYMIAGSKEAFVARPFLSFNINHVVSPLRLHKESCEVMAEAARAGIPIHANAFGQLGASSPVTLAGTIAQNVAEALVGMLFAWLINPEAKVILGPRPMITDLQTGAMSGGSGEQALLMAATAQVAQYYDLPNSCIAGATDSKTSDAQSGYEKSLTVTLAAQAGSNMITQACGMQAGLMAVAFESYIIDNDMLGSILRSLSPIDVNESTLAKTMIEEIVAGEGHFLGHPETYKRMKTDFLYPNIANRHSVQEWEEAGAKTMREMAVERTKELLENYSPSHFSGGIDSRLRREFELRLEPKGLHSRGNHS